MATHFNQLQAFAAKASIPLTAHLELTYKCNARCLHCFQDRDSAPNEMSTQDWIRVVEQAREAGSLIVTLSGGEAMVSPHFWPVAERARELGLGIRVFTNGIMLTRANVKRLATLNPMSVEVSIFSLRRDRHDRVTRVPGSLSRAIRGLFLLKRANIPVRLKCPILAQAGADHAAVRRLAERLNAGVVFDPQISPRFDGEKGPTACRGDDQSLVSYFKDAAQRGQEDVMPPPVHPNRGTCGMAHTFVSVSPEGKMLPCPLMQTSAGDVRKVPLGQLWRESPLMQKLRARRHGDLKECGTCSKSGYCGRCSAIAMLEDGDLDGPSKRACTMAELREQAWGIKLPVLAPTALETRATAVGTDQ